VSELPLPAELLRELALRHGTPLYVYDAATVLERVARLRALGTRGAEGSRGGSRGFDVLRYAQKANPNLALLGMLRASGVLVDAVSAGEVWRALAAGYEPREILFCADLFDRAALAVLREHDVPVVLGSPEMVEAYAALRPGRPVVLRVNPGFGHGHDRRVATGGEGSKHGIWHEELPAVAARAEALGSRVRGLHVHIGSGSDLEHLERASRALGSCARAAGGSLEMLSAGGGLPIPYREGEPEIDLERFARSWSDVRASLERELGRRIALEVEPGRYLVAEAGVLVTEVCATKHSGALACVLVDAGFHNLVRPALYGAYHRISVLGAGAGEPRPTIVAGPLCESADVFTQKGGGELEPRLLPPLRAGDLLAIHDAGAYAASMASGYNSQPLAAEVLVEHGRARLVRRRQSFEELLALETTLDLEGA